MTALPPITELTDADRTVAQVKAWLTDMRAYLDGLLGDDGLPATAREALGVPLVNRIINPDGAIYQRAVAATADDTYFADRWYMLTQTGSVTPSVLTNPENGYPAGIRITQSQASAQRFGYAQIIESLNCRDLRGKNAAFTPRIRVSNGQAIRYAILEWTGSVDAVTSDVVNDWTSGTYTAGNFFLGSDITVVEVGAVTPSANTWTSLTTIADAISASMNNLILVVWTEGTAAQNFTLDFDDHQITEGAVQRQAQRRPVQQELGLCQRYYEKSYDLATSPGATNQSPGSVMFRGSGVANRDFVLCAFKQTKRAVPTVTFYNHVTGASGSFRNVVASTDVSTTTNAAGQASVVMQSNGTSNTDDQCQFHWTAEAEL